MTTRLANLWDRMRGSYWFVPSILIAFALAASAGLPYLDRHRVDGGLFSDLPGLSAESARAILTTVAGTMATAVGLVFSLTILTLSIATSQFGPRLLRSFLNNRSTQIVLGTFVSSVIYALIVLQAVQNGDTGQGVPEISVYAAIAAAVFNLVYLVHFVNTIATLIQAPNVVARVAEDLDYSIDRLYPDVMAPGKDQAAECCALFEGSGVTLDAAKEGYLQGLDIEGLCQFAAGHDIALRLHYRPGQFVYRESPLATAYGAVEDEGATARELNAFVVTGHRRTPRQDVECALAELVELAVRALSPGINDPFTAVNCIDRLGAALGRAITREVPPAEFRDQDGAVRLAIPAVTFAELLDTAFNQIRQHGSGNTAVLIRLLEALNQIARQCRRSGDASAILRHVNMIERLSEREIQEPNDRDDIGRRIQSLRPRLEATTDA